MKGTGKTVFAGGKISDFQVEILGVLENIGPKQSLILARLSGGPLDKTGVMQGMSGSPVYLDGRIAGAVAMAFAFSKEPIAGIRPIEEMLQVGEVARARTVHLASLLDKKNAAILPEPDNTAFDGGKMVEIATPVSFGGFTRNTIEYFAPQLRALGLEPRQGVSGGGAVSPGLGDQRTLQAGSMITVQLLSGDFSVGADGTVTYIDGSRIYAFGHRFLQVGSTELPFARSEVLALLPNISTSFKISSPKQWMGTITEDRNTAVAGELGRRAKTIPLTISMVRRYSGGALDKPIVYRMEMVNDPVISPFLVQASVFSAIDATEQTVGRSSFAIKGKIDFQNGDAPVKLDNVYAGDFNLPAQVSLGTAAPLAYIMQSGFDRLQLRGVSVEIEAFDRKRQLQIDQVWASRREVRPGQSVDITVLMAGENGAERSDRITYRVPVGAPAGALQFTAADATTLNLTDYRQLLTVAPKSPAQLVSFLNALRPNTKAYVRVWRAEPNYEVQGESLPDPPPSLAMILSRAQASLSGPGIASANSKVAEFEIDAGGMAVSGSKTIQVEVKE